MNTDDSQSPAGFVPLPKSMVSQCFGCSQTNPHGLRMSFFGDGSSVRSHVVVPRYMCGWSRFVHGGILSAILDEIMSWSVLHVMKKIVLTKSMTVDFIKPASISERLLAVGTPVEILGRNEVLVKGVIKDSRGMRCAEATAIFALLKPLVAKRLGIIDDEGLKGIEKIIADTTLEPTAARRSS